MVVQPTPDSVAAPVSAEQLRALASPARQEIVDCLSANGPLSARELAQELGRRPDALYFHLRKLVDAGLVDAKGERRLTRHTETLYDAPRGLRIKYDVRDPETRDALAAVGAAMLRVAHADLERGLDAQGASWEASSGARSVGADRNVWPARVVGWVSKSELKRVNALLSEAFMILSGTRGGERKERVSLVWSLAPAPSGDDDG